MCDCGEGTRVYSGHAGFSSMAPYTLSCLCELFLCWVSILDSDSVSKQDVLPMSRLLALYRPTQCKKTRACRFCGVGDD